MVLYDQDMEHLTPAGACGGHLRSQFHTYIEPGVRELRRPDICPYVVLLEADPDIAMLLISVLPTAAPNMLGVRAAGYDLSHSPRGTAERQRTSQQPEGAGGLQFCSNAPRNVAAIHLRQRSGVQPRFMTISQ